MKMELILTISSNIITIGGAIIILLGVIAMIIIIKILLKINYIIKDVKEKYELVVGTMFKPINIIIHFINKLKKNG